MLPVYMVSKYNIRPLNGVLFQWLNISVRFCSSSDSSDSSDSDSDTEKVKRGETFFKSAKPATSDNKTDLGSFLNKMIQDKVILKATKNTPISSSMQVEQEDAKTKATNESDLTEFMNNMLKARKLEKTIDVAIQPRKSAPKKVKPLSYEKKLIRAAEDVADKLGGDKAKTTSDLLQKVLQYKTEAEKKDERLTTGTDQYKAKAEKKDEQVTRKKDSTKSDIDPMEFIKSKYFEKPNLAKNEKRESSMSERHSKSKSVIQTLLHEYNKQVETRNVTRQLSKNDVPVQQSRKNEQRKPFTRQDLNIWNGAPSQAFENMGDASPDIPELKMWAALEQRELKALTTYSPANVFQEMILWTEQGKLWKFPIDNEQGMEEEQNVHFSEHVFTERYLKGWCPTAGPIRHFMELVCVGLSKNPYMTVQEKINHIMWYKDYFKSKEELLQELGAIKEPFSDTTKQITQ
ncbi:PREDICTED: 28S ribosomal protein S31, mitochondrial [Dinoponera quadriceps]|uniref:Small ribosomal subunit protein mS31 n=1 Tax=Dinoponera quadriceps TaxID=609295 RepID=A0A6P3X422_DINQU|nr:PREDICTED: 28S ribosomal protein S31, mitochondrial [Dinoponera quadriceps]XP_014473065.1 PREDICTED: 28S ribosomal protein S31, mitochondrial [Dinoponera quadriceps]